jgi:hypothetical protein
MLHLATPNFIKAITPFDQQEFPHTVLHYKRNP